MFGDLTFERKFLYSESEQMTTETPSQPTKYGWGQHPNSRKNLRPFPSPGDLNRQGKSLTLRLREQLEKPLEPPPPDAPVREHIVYSTIEGALKREPTPFHEVWDRVEGRLDRIQIAVDNRRLSIYVRDAETKELLSQLGERTEELAVGDSEEGKEGE